MSFVLKHADRTRAFAEAAIEVISDVGVDAARLRDVAKAASVTTGALTHYFDGKDELFEAALSHIVSNILAQQRAADRMEDPVAAAARFLPNTEERLRQWRVWFAFWGRAIVDERLRRQHRRFYAEIIALLADDMRTAQRAGMIAADADPVALADAIVAAIDGLSIRATLEPEDWSAERQLRTLDLMIGSILKPAAQTA